MRYTQQELGLMVNMLEHLVMQAGGRIDIPTWQLHEIAGRENTLRVMMMEDPRSFRLDLRRFETHLHIDQPALATVYEGELVEDDDPRE